MTYQEMSFNITEVLPASMEHRTIWFSRSENGLFKGKQRSYRSIDEKCNILHFIVYYMYKLPFQVKYDNLIEAFTSRSTFARGEMIFSPVSAVKAVDIRDAFVKGIYGRIFVWIVNKINTAIFTPKVSIKKKNRREDNF